MAITNNALKLWLAIAVLFSLAMFAIDQSFLANVGFLVSGALVATVTQLVSESRRRTELEKDLARSLYEELANRVARCVFDFEKPWGRWVQTRNVSPTEVDLQRLRRFMPVAPTIYPATAGQIALLGCAAQAVIRFYAQFMIFRTDMEHVARFCEINRLSHVPPDQVASLAERLRRTLKPGLEALRLLSRYVSDYEKIDAEAIADADRLFKHERAHLPLRQRLEHYVTGP